MSELTLTDHERRLIVAMREIPASAIRSRVLTVVDELVHLASEPRCHESQGDGVPCASEKRLCESCERVFTRAREIVETTFPAPLVALPAL